MRSRLLLALATPTLGATACVDYEMHTSKDPIVEESEALQTTEASATPETPAAPEPCTDDPAPQLLGAAPEDGQVLSIDASVVLEAWVDDAPASPVDLTVEWFDSAGNAISVSQPDDEGYASALWSDPRPHGPQQLDLRVTDTCGNVVEQSISVCQQASWHQDEIALDSWHLEGDAQILPDGTLQLTELDPWQIGSAFLVAQEVPAGEVDIRFEFLTEGGTGADGISLTALDVDRMTGFLGGAGCGLGYGGGTACTEGPALPGWSIELDTWYNGELPDPTTDDHIAFTFDGQVATPEVWEPVPDLEESGWHTVEVSVRAPRITVYIDGTLYMDAEVDGEFDFPAVIGFTGSTGGQTNLHWIRSLEVTELACPDETIEDENDAPSDEPDWEPEDDADTDADLVESTVVVSSDWGAGWCADVTVTNIGEGAALWTSRIPVDGTINTIWSAELWWTVRTGSSGRALEPGPRAGRRDRFGFCATR